MPMTQGQITSAGAVISVLVGVGPRRAALLNKYQMRVPDPVDIRAQLDTGANISGFAGRVFTALELPPVGQVNILTPSTPAGRPHPCDLFDVTLYLVVNGRGEPFLHTQVIAADGWHPDREEGVEGLIGRDVLNRASLMYYGLEGTFTFGF